MAKEKNKKGFTLIELIIAIAVLVILTGILAPQIVKYIEKARQAKIIHGFDEVCHAFETVWMDPENPFPITVTGEKQLFINAGVGPGLSPADKEFEEYASSYMQELFGSEADKYVGYIYFIDGRIVYQYWFYLPDGKPESPRGKANYYFYSYDMASMEGQLEGPFNDANWNPLP